MTDNRKNEFKDSNDILQIKDLFNICLSNWYWFLLSLVVCLGIAAYKILKTPPVYSRTATVMIKPSNVQKYSSSDLDQIISKNGITTGNTKLVNEKITLTSFSLMTEVVERNQFNVQYFVDGRMHKNILYGNELPYEVVFHDLDDDEYAGFTLLKKDNGYEMTDFIKKGLTEEQSETVVACDIISTVRTPLGQISLRPTDNYFGTESDDPVYITHSGVTSTARSFIGKLKVEDADKEADVVLITFNDISAKRAEDVLNGVIDIYNEKWVDDRNKVAQSTSKFISERLESLERDLGSVDDDISSYKSRNLMPDVTSTSSMYMSQSSEMMRQLQELDNELYAAKFIKNYLRNQSSKNQLIPTSVAVSSTSISAQIGTYNQLLLKRNSMVDNSSESNPLVIDMDKQLSSLRTAIVSSVDSQISTLEAQIENVRRREEKTNEKIAASPNQAKYLLNVERQQKVKESLYLFLLQKREENELGQAFTAYNTRVINPPIGSNTPVAPLKMKILMIAFLIGLCIPLVIFYLIKITDTKIRTRHDLENLSVPFIGEIPQRMESDGKLKSAIIGKKASLALYVKHGKRDILNEAFRVLRTRLEFMTEKNSCNKIVITSFNVGSGKSFISLNLSAALAINRKKVLTIDADLRHASLSKTIGSPKKGLSNYLAGQFDDIHEVIVHHQDCDALDILPVGTIPPNPSEIISSERFKTVISLLEKEYEYIILDCPPIDIVADTQIVEQQANRTLFVVRSGLLDRDMLPELQEIYDNTKFKNMGIVLNGTGSDGSLYGYRNGYRYSYKYGYSYHSYGYNYYSDKEDKGY